MSIQPLTRCALLLTVGLLAVTAAQTVAAQDAAITPKVKQIYKNDCALCHGDNGNGKSDLATQMNLTLADYTDPKSLAGKSDQELFDEIRKGKDKMPPEEEARAKDADVRGLVAYVRSMSKGGQTAAAPRATPPGNH
jgi:mono/diheme cytochrome c family protein